MARDWSELFITDGHGEAGAGAGALDGEEGATVGKRGGLFRRLRVLDRGGLSIAA